MILKHLGRKLPVTLLFCMMTLFLQDGTSQATLISGCGGNGYGTIDVGWLFRWLKLYSVRIDTYPVCKPMNSLGGFGGYSSTMCAATNSKCYVSSGENLTVMAFDVSYTEGFEMGGMVSARFDATWTVGYQAKSKFQIQGGIDSQPYSGSFNLVWNYDYESSSSNSTYFYCMVPVTYRSMWRLS